MSGSNPGATGSGDTGRRPTQGIPADEASWLLTCSNLILTEALAGRGPPLRHVLLSASLQ